MDFTADWKSRWPIVSTFDPPLLIQNQNKQDLQKNSLGPLLFASDPNSSTTLLLQSPSLAPRLPPPYPNLVLPRFVQNYSSIPAASISALLGHQLPDYSSHFHGFNSLQLLQIPNKNLVIVFFPSGDNLDRVGFSLFGVKDGVLSARSQGGNSFHEVKEGNVSRQCIARLLVNPVDDNIGNVGTNNNSVIVVGNLMVCTDYSVCWYRVGISTYRKQDEFSACVDYLGCVDSKVFRGNAVVSACWSPHLRQECLVLLGNGDLFLFDVNSSCGGKGNSRSLVSGNMNVVTRILRVKLNDKLGLKEENGDEELRWFGCEFSWHPRIFIASHRNEVYLVDLRSSGVCNICCLLKFPMLSMGSKYGFLALSRAGPDGFSFAVATRQLLLLCDVRKPLMPVLQWSHGLQHPQYITTFRLSELRANAEDTKYKLASESGYCIMLGSFWDGEFSLFCYGPDLSGSVASEISKFCSSYYAWGLPSEVSLSSCVCNCGDCLVREEFLKESTPVWIDWRQKKHLILGFGILGPDISAQLSSHDGFGGFTLVKLTSSGKLEAEHYHAVWENKIISDVGNKRKSVYLEDNLLYDCSNSEYDGKKKFQHLKFELLNAYLEDKLAKYIVGKRKRKKKINEDAPHQKDQVKSKSNFHQEICSKLKDFGLPRMRSTLAVSDVLKDIILPTSIHEIALRSSCAALPTYILQLAFSTYSDINKEHDNHKEPLEFLDISNLLQVPPFPLREPSHRSNKWSSKNRPSDAIVGPILPPPFLTTLHQICIEEAKEEKELYFEETDEFSAHSQSKLMCDKVVEVVDEHVTEFDTNEDDFVSLDADIEDMSSVHKRLKFSYHKPLSFLENPGFENDIFSTHVFRRSQEPDSDSTAGMAGEELFDAGCPIELKFDKGDFNFGPTELELYQHLKRQQLDFQKQFKPYQEFIVKGENTQSRSGRQQC